MVTTKKNKRFLFPTEEDYFFSDIDNEIEEVEEEEENTDVEGQTKIIKPEYFDDAKLACECMLAGIANVVVDLSYIINEENGVRTAERIIDFLFGVSLPLNLYVARVNETTFIFSKEHLNG